MRFVASLAVVVVVFAAAAPCALAVCGTTHMHACCGDTASCCCTHGKPQRPAPSPVTPSPRASDDTNALPAGAVAIPGAEGDGLARLASATVPHTFEAAPIYVAVCAFRC